MTIRGLKGHGMFTPTNDTPLGAPIGLFRAISQFELTKTVESENETGWPAASEDFRQQTLRVIQTAVTWTLGITMKDLDWESIQILMQTFDQLTVSYPEDETFSGRVPSTAPFEYTNADLITAAATVTNTHVSIGERGTWGEIGPLNVVAAAPADSTEVQLDTTTGKLIFHADQAGMPWKAKTVVNRANIRTIGYESGGLALDTLGFTGIIVTDATKTPNGIRMKVPKMESDGNVTFTMGDTTPEFQLTFTMVQEVGQNNVIHFARRLAAA